MNWQPRNLAKGPGELRRNSLAHVARGADALMFFQWRASRFGLPEEIERYLKAAGFKNVETAVVYREQEAPHFETMLATGEK